MTQAPIFVRRGDTFFTRSGSLLGQLIRWGETHPGDESSWANHTGVVVEAGWIGTPTVTQGYLIPGYDKQAVVVEALWHTRRGPLKLNGTLVRVFRPVPPYTEEELGRFVADAGTYVGDKYGWWKLLGLLGDRTFFKGRKVISSLFFVKSRPICSFLSALVGAAARAIGKAWRPDPMGPVVTWPGFGCPPQAADPDTMMDFCLAHPEYWAEVPPEPETF
jgi:hypothetical protein